MGELGRGADSRSEADWQALFLAAPAPGAVFRFLERLPPRLPEAGQEPVTLLLSDPVPPHGYRAFLVPGIRREALSAAGKQLSTAFPRPLYLLWQSGMASSEVRAEWGFTRWSEGNETGGEQYPLHSLPLWQRWLSRLPGSYVLSPPLAWAKQRGLPVERLPGVGPGSPHLIDYATVSALDQRSLLVENSARLYRFILPSFPFSSSSAV